jgi:hypothetical protein
LQVNKYIYREGFNSMATQTLVHLLYFYGIFLVLCGVNAVILIGKKAKTALMSGGMSGAISLFIAYSYSVGAMWAPAAGLVLSLALFIVFSWRSAKTLFKIFELLPSSDKDLKGKGIAFLIISLMAIVSIVVFILQVVNFY